MTVHDLFTALFNAALVTMLITLVTSLGLGFTVAELLAPMRRVWVVIAALAINCAVVPLVTWGICDLFPLSAAATTGMVLACMSSGGPAGLKAAQMTKRADMALAVSLTVLLQLTNIVAAPLWAGAVVSGATVELWTVVEDLLILVLIPLVVGLFIRARYIEHAASLRADLEKISNLALLAAIALGIAANWKPFVDQIGSWVIVVSVVLVIVFTGLGALIGLRDTPTALSGAMVTPMRFTPLGMIVISTQLGNNPALLAPTLVMGLVITFLVLGGGAEIGRFLQSRSPVAPRPGRTRLDSPGSTATAPASRPPSSSP